MLAARAVGQRGRAARRPGRDGGARDGVRDRRVGGRRQVRAVLLDRAERDDEQRRLGELGPSRVGQRSHPGSLEPAPRAGRTHDDGGGDEGRRAAGGTNGPFTTIAPDGTPISRPMAMQEVEFDGDRGSSPHAVPQGVPHRREPSGQRHHIGKLELVSLTGHAVVIDDLEKKRQLWNTVVEAWFPDGPEDLDVVLLRVDAASAEYWTPGGRLASAISFAKAKLTGEPYDGGENERCSSRSRAPARPAGTLAGPGGSGGSGPYRRHAEQHGLARIGPVCEWSRWLRGVARIRVARAASVRLALPRTHSGSGSVQRQAGEELGRRRSRRGRSRSGRTSCRRRRSAGCAARRTAPTTARPAGTHPRLGRCRRGSSRWRTGRRIVAHRVDQADHAAGAAEVEPGRASPSADRWKNER